MVKYLLFTTFFLARWILVMSQLTPDAKKDGEVEAQCREDLCFAKHECDYISKMEWVAFIEKQSNNKIQAETFDELPIALRYAWSSTLCSLEICFCEQFLLDDLFDISESDFHDFCDDIQTYINLSLLKSRGVPSVRHEEKYENTQKSGNIRNITKSNLISRSSECPTKEPYNVQSLYFSEIPSLLQTCSIIPTIECTIPTYFPSVSPSRYPSSDPSTMPSSLPSSLPSDIPSSDPSLIPSSLPSSLPSTLPSATPSDYPSISPSDDPSSGPSTKPSSLPSSFPTSIPSDDPSSDPSLNPSSIPSSLPTTLPSSRPSDYPSVSPSIDPSSSPSILPSDGPSSDPSLIPSSIPSLLPTTAPSASPSDDPSVSPSIDPSSFLPPTNSPTFVEEIYVFYDYTTTYTTGVDPNLSLQSAIENVIHDSFDCVAISDICVPYKLAIIINIYVYPCFGQPPEKKCILVSSSVIIRSKVYNIRASIEERENIRSVVSNELNESVKEGGLIYNELNPEKLD